MAECGFLTNSTNTRTSQELVRNANSQPHLGTLKQQGGTDIRFGIYKTKPAVISEVVASNTFGSNENVKQQQSREV